MLRLLTVALFLVSCCPAVAVARGPWQESAPGLTREDIEPWLGAYVSDAETITFSWRDGLLFQMDLIEIPVDARWHETVSTFAVRHRARWIAERGVLVFQEQHNYVALDAEQDAGWRYEFRLNRATHEIQKILLANQTETVVRVYRRGR